MNTAKNIVKYNRRFTCPAKQRGASLFIALIALVSMTLAGIAMVRSVDTTNVIAGNLAFRQSALHTTDVGVEAAFNALTAITGSALEANYPSGCAAGACNYYPTIQTTDTKGVPDNIIWSSVVNPITVNGSYEVRYVIDRLCQGPAPVTDISGKCYADAMAAPGTKKAGGAVFSSAQAVYYRITVRVAGPRNTTSLVQAIIAK